MAERSNPSVDNEKLIELAGLFLPGENAYAKEVALAGEDPARYVAEFQDRLELRGISEPHPDLPWLALVDGLWARGKLVEIDWREAPGEIADELDPLVEAALPEGDRWDWMDDGDWEDAETADFLTEVGKRLVPAGFVLACIDIKADSYPLTVLPVEGFPAVQKLGRESGYGSILRLDQDA